MGEEQLLDVLNRIEGDFLGDGWIDNSREKPRVTNGVS
jgi:hypothetical protein